MFKLTDTTLWSSLWFVTSFCGWSTRYHKVVLTWVYDLVLGLINLTRQNVVVLIPQPSLRLGFGVDLPGTTLWSSPGFVIWYLGLSARQNVVVFIIVCDLVLMRSSSWLVTWFCGWSTRHHVVVLTWFYDLVLGLIYQEPRCDPHLSLWLNFRFDQPGNTLWSSSRFVTRFLEVHLPDTTI